MEVPVIRTQNEVNDQSKPAEVAENKCTQLDELDFTKLKLDTDTTSIDLKDTTAAPTSATASSSTSSSTSNSTNTTISTGNLVQIQNAETSAHTGKLSTSKANNDVKEMSTLKALDKITMSKSIGNLTVPNKNAHKQDKHMSAQQQQHHHQSSQNQAQNNQRHFSNGNQMLSKSMSIKYTKKQRPVDSSINANNHKLNRYSSAITSADLVTSNANFANPNQYSKQNYLSSGSFSYHKRNYYAFYVTRMHK